MKFEVWWNTLSSKEQAVIGENNARFVWQQACDACAKLVEKKAEKEWISVDKMADAVKKLGEA